MMTSEASVKPVQFRYFKGDKWNCFYGFVIPFGAPVRVVRFYTHRRVKVEYNGEFYMTMLWALSKEALK